MQKLFAIAITMAVLTCGTLYPSMASAGSLGTYCNSNLGPMLFQGAVSSTSETMRRQ